MRTDNKLGNLLTIVLVLCAVTVTGLLVRREIMPFTGTNQQQRSSSPAVVRIRAPDSLVYGENLIGPRHADVRIVEFADFQCPYCARAVDSLKALLSEFRGQVGIVFRHLPLVDLHPHAMEAALASECAAHQGRFSAFHDELFRYHPRATTDCTSLPRIETAATNTW